MEYPNKISNTSLTASTIFQGVTNPSVISVTQTDRQTAFQFYIVDNCMYIQRNPSKHTPLNGGQPLYNRCLFKFQLNYHY